MAKKISVGTNKGGVLKTTTAVNIASILANRGYKVLLVDVDSQGNTALSFGYIPDDFEDTIYDVLMNKKSVKEVLYRPLKDLELYIVPANDDMSYFTLDILKEGFKNPGLDVTNIIKDKFKIIEDDFDFIIFDSPPSLDVIQANVLAYVDSVLIPYQPEPYSMRSIQMFMERMKEYQKVNPNLKIEGVLITLFDPRTNTHKANVVALSKFCEAKKIKLYDTPIKKTIKMSESIFNFRLPPVLIKKYKNNDVIRSYEQVATEIEHNR